MDRWEQLTLESRRAISLAFISASRSASPVVRTDHLLEGLFSENPALVSRMLVGEDSKDSLREWIGVKYPIDKKIATFQMNVSLGDEGNKVLSLAKEEAERMGSQQIGAEHLLLGLLREEDGPAMQLLRKRAADIEGVRRELQINPHRTPSEKERMAGPAERIRKVLAATPAITSSRMGKFAESEDALGRYTEQSRRLIFFARSEAILAGSREVETKHLLLVVLREEESHFGLFLPLAESKEAVCKLIETRKNGDRTTGSQVEVSAINNLPLSEECKRVQSLADEEATLMGSRRIEPHHLLMGMLREEDSFAARLLREHGAEIGRIRSGLKASQNQPPSNPADPSQPSSSEPAA